MLFLTNKNSRNLKHSREMPLFVMMSFVISCKHRPQNGFTAESWGGNAILRGMSRIVVSYGKSLGDSRYWKGILGEGQHYFTEAVVDTSLFSLLISLK